MYSPSSSLKVIQIPAKLQTLPGDNVLTTSAYAEPLTDRVSNSTYVSMTHPIVQYIVYYKHMYCLM